MQYFDMESVFKDVYRLCFQQGIKDMPVIICFISGFYELEFWDKTEDRHGNQNNYWARSNFGICCSL